MPALLAGKRALVTAASEGLGLASALRLAEHGARVAICARHEPALSHAAAAITAKGGGMAIPLIADLSLGESVERLAADAIAALGGLDILVVNSGHIPYGGLETLADADWYGAFDLLVMSAVRLVRAAIPAMRTVGGGSIVFIGSSSVRNPPPHLLLSSVMRLGVAGLAKTLARSLAADNIRVNVAAPGYFRTGRVRARIEEKVAAGSSAAQAMREIAGDHPMRRIGEAEELDDLVLFLAGPHARFLNGAHIPIDGGANPYPL